MTRAKKKTSVTRPPMPTLQQAKAMTDYQIMGLPQNVIARKMGITRKSVNELISRGQLRLADVLAWYKSCGMNLNPEDIINQITGELAQPRQ